MVVLRKLSTIVNSYIISFFYFIQGGGGIFEAADFSDKTKEPV